MYVAPDEFLDMPWMDRFPDELLVMIFELVNHKATLSALIRSSCRFSRIANVYSYASIDLHAGYARKHVVLRRLLRAFSCKPQYAQHVQRVQVHGELSSISRLDTRMFGKHLPLITDVPTSTLSNIIALCHTHTEVRDWRQAIAFEQDEDSVMALLLPKFVNIRSLSLRIDEHNDFTNGFLFRRCMVASMRFDASMSKLEDVMHATSDPNGPAADLATVLLSGWLHLPSVRRIFMHGLRSHYSIDSRRWDNMLCRSSEVHHMELRDIQLDKNIFFHLLRTPRALRTFALEPRCCKYSNDSMPTLDTVLNFLKRHCATLENLWLDMPWVQNPEDVYDHLQLRIEPKLMQSLSSFVALRHLRIACPYLFGDEFERTPTAEDDIKDNHNLLADMLPENLERLRLTHCSYFTKHIEIAIGAILASMADPPSRPSPGPRFPRLREIILEFSNVTVSQMIARAPLDAMRTLWEIGNYADIDVRFLAVSEIEEPPQERRWGMDEDIIWPRCVGRAASRHRLEDVDIYDDDGVPDGEVLGDSPYPFH